MGKPVSYIQMMINNNGDDWIIALRPEDIQRSSKRIVKDMVRGIIDYESTCKYFLIALMSLCVNIFVML